MNFVISVMCLAHIHACPIPSGYHAIKQFSNKKECIESAKTVIVALGYATADFSIGCREK